MGTGPNSPTKVLRISPGSPAEMTGSKSVDVDQTKGECFLLESYGFELLEAFYSLAELVEEGLDHLLLIAKHFWRCYRPAYSGQLIPARSPASLRQAQAIRLVV
jgi:hypothetical protein